MIIHPKHFSLIILALFSLLRQFDNGIKLRINFLKLRSLLQMNNQLWLQDNLLSALLLLIIISFAFPGVHGSLECFRLYPGDYAIFMFH